MSRSVDASPRQFGFTISPITNRLVPAGQIAVETFPKHPDWISVSATGLLAAAHLADLKDSGEPRSSLVVEGEEQQLALAAGTALHAAEQGHFLLQKSRPRQSPREQDYYQRLGRIGQLLPTSSQREVRHWQETLGRRELALDARDTGPAEQRCLDIIDGVILREALVHPPFTSTYPLWPRETPLMPAFANPKRLSQRWEREVVPALQGKLDRLRQWERVHPPEEGAEFSNTRTGSVNGLPEVNLKLVIPPLGVSVIRRSDQLTRRHTGQDGALIVHETDFKSSRVIPVPNEGSNIETATAFLTYVIAVGLIAGGVKQLRDGAPLVGIMSPTPQAPLTASSRDSVSITYVALGGETPETVDFAKVYNGEITDPIQAAELLEQTSDLLDRIRRDPDLRSVAQVRRKKK